MIPKKSVIELVRGQDLDVHITVTDSVTGQPIDLSGYTLSFGVSEMLSAPYMHLAPTSFDANVLVARLDDLFTKTLVRPKYYFSAWIEIIQTVTPVAVGVINVYDDPKNY